MSKRKHDLARVRELKNELAQAQAQIRILNAKDVEIGSDEYWMIENDIRDLTDTISYCLSMLHPKGNLFWGEKRLTFKYRTAYSGEDEWAPVGLFRILSTTDRIYDEDDQYGDQWSRYCLVKAPFGVSQEDIEAVLNNYFDSSCTCEHDCCGHVSTYGNYIKNTKRREHLVRLDYSVNC